MSSSRSLRVNSLGIAQRPSIWERVRDRGPQRSPVSNIEDFRRPVLDEQREATARPWFLIAVAMLVAGLLLGIVLWRDAKAQSASRNLSVTATTLAPTSFVASTASIATKPSATTKPSGPNVYVSGAVVHPGVYVVRDGSRINDALLAAGGALATANLDVINLASLVVDGDHVFVSLLGDPGTPVVGGTTTPTGPQMVALNTANAAQLEVLPGVGPATAAAIIEFRAKNGAFKSVDQLLGVPGIGPSKLDQMRSQIKL